VNSADETETYDAGGRLLTLKNRAGVTHTLAYDAQGRLSMVTHSFGEQLSFTYDTYGRLATMTAPGGATYTYGYVSTISRLSSVTYPDTRVRSYYLEDAWHPNYVTGINDENGNRYSTYAYVSDPIGKATLSELSGGADHVGLSYVSGTRTTVTDALGVARDYDFTSILVRYTARPSARCARPAEVHRNRRPSTRTAMFCRGPISTTT